MKGIINTDVTARRNVPPLADVMQIAKNPDLDCLRTNAYLVTFKANHGFCNEVALLVRQPGSEYFHDRNDILNESQMSTVPSKTSYQPHCRPRFWI